MSALTILYKDHGIAPLLLYCKSQRVSDELEPQAERRPTSEDLEDLSVFFYEKREE